MEGGQKNVDVWTKLNGIHISWVKKLYENCFQEWKIIPLYLLKKTLGPSFKF